MAKRIFTRLGEAEAKVHGTTIQKVHFHEVGAVDSIADIVGSAIGLDLLGIERIVCSPVPTGAGCVEIAHGRVSIPAPATAELLTGIPLAPQLRRGGTDHAHRRGDRGHAGRELWAAAGDADRARSATAPAHGIWSSSRTCCGCWWERPESTPAVRPADQVWVLETNLDDVSGEIVGHTIGTTLLEAGALDVYTTPIQMKKNRPGVIAERDLPGGGHRAAGADHLRRNDHAGYPALAGRPPHIQRRA